MKNDFVLFPDPESEEAKLDADASLITAYLSQELSPVQTAAVEDRLDSDPAFRENVRPIIELWTAGGSLGDHDTAPAAVSGATSLSDAEIDAGWRRHATRGRNSNMQAHLATRGAHRLIPQSRRTSMSRIAAVIAVTVVPVFAFAQVVKYVANHDVPGRTIAQRITEIGDAKEERALTLAPGEQATPVVDLPAPTARTARTLRAILGLKQTEAGRLLVNDPLSRQVLLFERDLSTATAVLDSTTGTSKSYPARNPNPDNALSWNVLHGFVGDSAVFGPLPGNNTQTLLVLDARGTVARTIALNQTTGLFSLRDTYWDQQGRPVSMTPPPASRETFLARYSGRWWSDGYASGSVAMRTDSMLVVARLADFTTGRRDTLGRVNLPQNNPPGQAGVESVKSMGNGGGRLVPVGGPDGVCWFRDGVRPPDSCVTTAKQVVNPLYTVDDWAMLSDGTVAFVRGQDYHIDWVYPDGTMKSSGKLPFEWKKLTDVDKQRIVDSTRSAIDSLDAVAEVMDKQYGPWMDSIYNAERAAGRRAFRGSGIIYAHPGPPVRWWPYEIVPVSQIADYYPPIRTAAAKPDADGNLWILPRTSTLSRQGELVYDVVNPTRGLAQRVRLPLGRSIAGFGKGGVVYLQSGDTKNGFILERSTLPRPIPK